MRSPIKACGSNEEQDANGNRLVSPASQDPYGDAGDANAQHGNIRPASEDPNGDPADQNDTN